MSNITHSHFAPRVSEMLGFIYSSPPTSCFIIRPPSAIIVRINWLLSSCLTRTEWMLFIPIFNLFSKLTLDPERELIFFRIFFVSIFWHFMWILVLTVKRGWIIGISLIKFSIAVMTLPLIVLFLSFLFFGLKMRT